MLAVCAVAFLSLSGYLQLSRTPALAALLTGAVLLGLALLCLLLGRRRGAPERSRRGRRNNRPDDDLETLLAERVDPVLGRWLERYPERAALVALLLGIGAGYSRSTRRILQDLYNQYGDTESRRRGSDRR